VKNTAKKDYALHKKLCLCYDISMIQLTNGEEIDIKLQKPVVTAVLNTHLDYVDASKGMMIYKSIKKKLKNSAFILKEEQL